VFITRKFRESFRSCRMRVRIPSRSAGDKALYGIPILEVEIVALVFRIELKARFPSLLDLRIEPFVDG
jgi:hypothetical protein